MIEKQVVQIRNNMEKKNTEELLRIWKENDREQWSDEAFEAIKQLLLDRGETLPDQNKILQVQEDKEDHLMGKYANILSGVGIILAGAFISNIEASGDWPLILSYGAYAVGGMEYI
jgi:hypothetical protein